jgi:hypothetical protein
MPSTDAKPSDLAVGELLNNTYRLDEEIGQGGMGRVFRATDTRLDRKVAVKALLAANLDTETLRRFDRETQVMGQLDHVGIVTLYAFGRTRNVPWLAMQLLEGHDLWGELDTHGGRMAPQAALPIARQILETLAYLHGRNTLHRDLKPSNIHVGARGKVTLCDFGLARGHRSTLTRTGVIWGTPEYMAPEQILAERELDGRTDLYALSVVLFRMLSGVSLFSGLADQELLKAHLSDPRPDISRAVPGLSPLLGAALQKGLAIHAEDRFQTAEEMLASLEVVLALPVAAAKVPGPVPSAPKPQRRTADGTVVMPVPTAPIRRTPDGRRITRDDTKSVQVEVSHDVTAPDGRPAYVDSTPDGTTRPLGLPAMRETLTDEDDTSAASDALSGPGATVTPDDDALDAAQTRVPESASGSVSVTPSNDAPEAASGSVSVTPVNPPLNDEPWTALKIGVLVLGAVTLVLVGLALMKLLM